MFVAAFTVVIYVVYVVVALAGIGIIALGISIRRWNSRVGGLVLILFGVVVVLIPAAGIASSYLPGQS